MVGRDSKVETSGISNPVVPLVIGLVVMAGGGYLYYSGMQATANAEEVEATVVSSSVVDNDDTAEDNPEGFSVRVEYRYEYEGQTYTSTELCPGAGSACEPSSDFRTDMRDFLEDYPEGGTVTAYVPPSNPRGTFLIETGQSTIYHGEAGIGLLRVLGGADHLRGG
jgi:hypothetical protein